MAILSLSSWLLLAVPASAIASSDIASWYGLAGTQIQNKIFLTGGILSWGNWTDASGSFGNPVLDQSSLTGLIYQIDLNQSINIAQNNTSDYVLQSPQPSVSGGYPGYAWGALFGNDYTWFTFGGLATQSVTQPGITTITRGKEFCQGCSQGSDAFSVQVQYNQPLTNPVSDYITNGAYTSSPILGLGWWFGGLTSTNDSAPIEYSPTSDSNKATQPSRIFIEATLASDGSAGISFAYRNVPSWLTSRSESALTWLPYGKKGILVLMGGVGMPADIFTELTGTPANNTYMTELAIYDVDQQQWYNQSTLENGTNPRPQQMAGFCTAVVATADGNGHEIFVYGGYDGTWANTNPLDDVWVLSVPAFQWTKVYDGSKTTAHGRQSNVCIAPNPSTLISIGGAGSLDGPLATQHGLDIFDLNTLNWTGIYDASSKDSLKVPQKVVDQIGGSVNGPGANAQPTGLSSGVASLISNPFQQATQTFYPYAGPSKSTASPTSSPTNTGSPKSGSKSNHTALIAALATVIPVVIIAAIIAFCCVRRRRKNKEGVERTQRSRGNVFSWLGKSSPIDPAPEKSHTSDETAVNSNPEFTHDKQANCEVYEAPSNPPTPGWGNQASPRVLSGSMATSPFMGSAEVDAQSRHEIMDHVPRDGQSFRQHHMYPRSLSGDQIMSVRSDSISHASTSVMPSRHYGYVSPYELPHDRSHEDLAAPPADVNLGAPRAEANPNASSHSLGVGAEHVHSPVALIPVAPFSRKPVNNTEDDRPRHQRNQSSMSSDLPNLPSPGPEEDRRRSRLIETLPDPKSAQNSPVQPQTAKRSVYTENLDS